MTELRKRMLEELQRRILLPLPFATTSAQFATSQLTFINRLTNWAEQLRPIPTAYVTDRKLGTGTIENRLTSPPFLFSRKFSNATILSCTTRSDQIADEAPVVLSPEQLKS